MKKTRKIPLRLCVGCQVMHPKREMIRVLRDPVGNISLDNTGKKSGRGAYLCKNRNCLLAAKKGHRLERSLGCRVSDEVYDALGERLLEILEEETEREKYGETAGHSDNLP